MSTPRTQRGSTDGYTVYANFDTRSTHLDETMLYVPVLWDDGWHEWGYLPPPPSLWARIASCILPLRKRNKR